MELLSVDEISYLYEELFASLFYNIFCSKLALSVYIRTAVRIHCMVCWHISHLHVFRSHAHRNIFCDLVEAHDCYGVDRR